MFARAFHYSPAASSIVRFPDHVIVDVNDAFAQTLGYEREDILGKTPQELKFWVTPEKLPEFREELRARGFVRNYEVEVRARDGSIRTMLVSSQIVHIDGVPHSMSAGVDITERKHAEAQLRENELRLRESEAHFRAAFHNSPVLMTIGRLADARFIEVNEAFMRLIGLKRTEIVGRTSLELGLWVDPGERAAFYERLKRDHIVRNFECRIRSRRGTIHTMHVSGEIIEINREPHLITFALDVTQNKQAEAELQKALAQERELSQLKSDFVSLVSHEFRTPLEVIMSSADNLERYHDRLPPEKRQQLLRTIHKSVSRMSYMMEDVLLMGRFESGRMEFKPVAFDLASFCQRLCDEMETARNHRCLIRLTVEGRLTAARGDEVVLRHILTNLLSNAVKYSEAGRPVDLNVSRRGKDAVFKVVDRGCGIPATDQARLFQAFHRASNARQFPGTGLGLVIVQRSVLLHGGRVEIESTEGKGTIVTVTLPLLGKRP